MGYTRSIRIFELLSIIGNVILCLLILHDHQISLPAYLVLLIVAWLCADLVSGFVHWLADTYGKLEWPILGNTFIRSFYEHHRDPLSITGHDWIETNGNNFFVGIPVLTGCYLLTDISSIVAVFFVLLNIWTALTNHHRFPFEGSYNITHGNLNSLCNRMGLYRGLEFLVEKLFRGQNNRYSN